MRTLFTVLIIPFALMSCGTTNNKSMTEMKTDAASIADSFWVLETLNEEQITHPEDPREIGFKLDSNNNRISGFGGCNNFMGSYTLSNTDQIKFSQIASTKMACFQSTFDERLLFEALEKVDNYIVSVNHLILKSGNKTILTFKKSSAQDENEVVEKYWKLKTLDGKEFKMDDELGQEVHFILKAHNNTISGYDGCNTFSGEVEMNDDHTFTASKMRSTLRACPDSSFDEAKFHSLFVGPVKYEIAGDHLTLIQENKNLKATFEAVYFD